MSKTYPLIVTAIFCAVLGVASTVTAKKKDRLEFLSSNGMRGAVVAFDRKDCPRGWEEFVPARGRYIIGVNPPTIDGHPPVNGLTPRELGRPYGTDTLTLQVSNLPAHAHGYHDVYFSEAYGDSADGIVSVPGNSGSGKTDYDNHGLQIRRVSDATGDGAPVKFDAPSYSLIYCRLL